MTARRTAPRHGPTIAGLLAKFVGIPAGIADGEVPVYDEGSGLFIAGSPGGGGATTLGGLTDVDETGADAGEALISDGDGTWSPSAAAVILEGDSRLTNARTPSAHASSHAIGGSDRLRPFAIGAGQDVIPSAGEMSMPLGAVSNAGCATSNQVLRLIFFEAQVTETINNLTVYTGGTAAGATPTLIRMGVWSVNGSDDLTALLASTANDTSLLASTNTGYTKALSSSWSKVAGTRYAIGLLVVTGATAPQMTGQSVSASGLLSGGGNLPRVTAALTGQSDLPSTASAGSYVASASRPLFQMT